MKLFKIRGVTYDNVPIEDGAQPSTAVMGRAGRVPEGWRAELWRSTRCSAVVSIDYKGRNKHGYGRVPHGRAVSHGRKQLAAGPPSWILGGVSWAREQSRPARVYTQLAGGTGPGGWAGEQGLEAGQGNRAWRLGPAGLGSPPGPESHGHTHSLAVGVALYMSLEFFFYKKLISYRMPSLF